MKTLWWNYKIMDHSVANRAIRLFFVKFIVVYEVLFPSHVECVTCGMCCIRIWVFCPR
ncbi:hypothetical protein PR048_026365 [Dryococelus australis]|uniref:Uncharacterized protein n=1 Tax=Dryococelus australis TaxID=614101 RepID=A0ABQ9GL38_9NEOP|nr:hypothetical protein PR048_026365 [Dryococelus australis]